MDRSLMVPGECTRCHAVVDYDRNSAGWCNPCHNLGYAERQESLRLRREAQKEKGRVYWSARGIRIGQRVYTTAVNMFGTSAERVEGIASVGAVGAYVRSRFQKGYLQPDRFQAGK